MTKFRAGIIASSFAIVFTVIGCSDGLSDQDRELRKITKEIERTKKTIKTAEKKHGPLNAANEESAELPNFVILKDEKNAPHKRSVDVRLDAPLDANTLEQIANRIRYSDLDKYNKTFILYYLPDMEIGAGAWAKSHFTPKLSVKVLGLTVEQETKQSNENAFDGKDVVGIWYDNRAYIGATITVYRENNNLFVHTLYKDGSNSTDQVSEKKLSGTIRLEDADSKSAYGEYWLLKGNELSIYDSEGLITKYRAK